MLSPHSGGAVPLADSTGEGGVHLSGGFIRFLLVQKKFVLQMKGPCAQTMMEGEGTAMHINLLKYKDNSHYCIEDKSGKKSAKGLR